MKNLLLFQVIFTLHLLCFNPVYGQDTLQIPGPLGFSALDIGIDYRYAAGRPLVPPDGSYNAYGIAISGRMQSSFVQNYLVDDNEVRRFRIGDILSAEFGLGGISTENRFQRSGLLLMYRFEFGLGTILKINDQQDIGVNLILLRFGRDRVSENISGSGILFRYRYKNFSVQAGVDSRRERIAGWALKHATGQNNPYQFVAGLSWMIDGRRNFGLRYEELGRGTTELLSPNVRIYFLNTLRVYYGIYF